ncbi:MAG: ATP-binding protein [Acidobacteriota bacterium]
MTRQATKHIDPDLQRQTEYADKLAASGFGFDLVVGEAFARGIRDLGYRDTGTALDELIDNSIQASASRVHLLFGYEGKGEKKPVRLAVVDDGHGMSPNAIRVGVLWGGTHREDDRSGFGRYGFGLPSAAVSMGRRYTVFSKTPGSTWYSVTFDIDEIAAGTFTEHGRVRIPEATPAKLPPWTGEYIAAQLGSTDLEHGTVIVIEKLDRLTWKTEAMLERQLLEHFGVTYRNFLRQAELAVNGKKVEIVDPLFLDPEGRFYDHDEDRAVSLPEAIFDVKDSTGSPRTVKVRFSYLPVTFQREDKKALKSPKTNPRFNILRAHHGIIVLRNGRQIDVVRPPSGWDITLANNDIHWKVEIDYPADLDEEFRITTSKQHVRVSPRMWEILEQHGVKNAIVGLRARFHQDNGRWKAERERAQVEGTEKRLSEQAMEDAARFRQRPQPPERQQKAQELLGERITRLAQETGLSAEEATARIETGIRARPYLVAEESAPGAPFFRVHQLGGQKILYLNTAHRFYTEVYASPPSTPEMRSALEVLLFVLGACELESAGDRARFYEAERQEWSIRLSVTLDLLQQMLAVTGEGGAEEAEAEVAPAAQS